MNPGDEVIIPTPCWVSYPEIVRIVGGVPVLVQGDVKKGFVTEAEDLAPYVTERTKALILNSPNNPNGCIWNREQLAGIAKLAVEKGFYVVSDEIYEKLIYDGEEHVSIASLDEDIFRQTIVINGVSKTYAMTGWRIGYLLAPEAVIEQTGKIAELMHSSVNSLAQYAGVAALAGPQDNVAAMREEYRAKRQIVLDGLAGCPVLRLIEPQGAFYAFVDVRLTGLDSGEFADRLLDEERVAVVPGEAFGEEGRGFVRLSYAGDADELREGVARLRAFAERVWNPITGHHTATYHPMEVLA